MPSRLLALPFILGAGVFLYLAWEVDTRYGMYIVPFILALTAIYIFQPQIDWWWYNRNLPDVEGPMKDMFEKRLPYYQHLSEEEKKRFRTRVALYLMAVEYIPQGPETVPEDIKGIVAANIVQLTFGQEDYRLSKFERIVIYLGPFPSPQFPRRFHASEIFEEDGVLLFAVNHLMPGTMEPHRFFNIGVYEYAKVFRLSYPDKAYPDLNEEHWKDLEQISGFKQKKIEDFVGLIDLDIWAVSVALFFSFPEQFKKQCPSVYEQHSDVFNQYPMQASPVVNNAFLAVEETT